MRQKFRVTWKHPEHDARLVIVLDNWSQLSGALDTLVELGVLSVDISIFEENYI